MSSSGFRRRAGADAPLYTTTAEPGN